MNFRQLRSLCEVVDRGLRVSAAAGALHQSQPSVSRQIQELEQELGTDIFIRNRNRILGITAQGREILALARRIVGDADALKSLVDDSVKATEGEFTLATTHTQARYVLPEVIARFVKKYPDVKLSLRQAEPTQCFDLVATGKADVAIGMSPTERPAEVVCIPCYRLDRCVIVPARHPLLRVRPLTLEAIARYPIIAYSDALRGGSIVSRTFAEGGLKPKIALHAVDADVSKTYVEMGLGIAILGSSAFNARRDRNLRAIDAQHLFKSSHINVGVRAQRYLRGYMLTFVNMFAPHIRRVDIEGALAGLVPTVRGRLPAAPRMDSFLY